MFAIVLINHLSWTFDHRVGRHRVWRYLLKTASCFPSLSSNSSSLWCFVVEHFILFSRLMHDNIFFCFRLQTWTFLIMGSLFPTRIHLKKTQSQTDLKAYEVNRRPYKAPDSSWNYAVYYISAPPFVQCTVQYVIVRAFLWPDHDIIQPQLSHFSLTDFDCCTRITTKTKCNFINMKFWHFLLLLVTRSKQYIEWPHCNDSLIQVVVLWP